MQAIKNLFNVYFPFKAFYQMVQLKWCKNKKKWRDINLKWLLTRKWTKKCNPNRYCKSINQCLHSYWIRKWINFNAKIQISANRLDILYFCTKWPENLYRQCLLHHHFKWINFNSKVKSSEKIFLKIYFCTDRHISKKIAKKWPN